MFLPLFDIVAFYELVFLEQCHRLASQKNALPCEVCEAKRGFLAVLR